MAVTTPISPTLAQMGLGVGPVLKYVLVTTVSVTVVHETVCSVTVR
jgi:hypothetical protein